MNTRSPILLPRGVSNTRNYQAAVANSATAITGTNSTSTSTTSHRRLPNRVQNFSQQSQKSSTSAARFSVCSGLSQAFHQQDGDEDDLSKYQFSMDGSVLWARKSTASSSFGGGDAGSQYSLTDDDDDDESVYVDLTGYYDEAVYKDNVPSQEELERIYLEMRAIRLKEEAELQKAMEASQLEHLDQQQTQRVNEAEMEIRQGTYEVQVDEPLLVVEDECDYDFDDGREEIFRGSRDGQELYPHSNDKTGQTNVSVDMTEQSSYSEAEVVGSIRSQKKKNETKKKNSFFRRLSNFFFPPSNKQDKVVRAIENANRQQARAAFSKMKSHQNKDGNNALRKSVPVVLTKTPVTSPTTARQQRQQMRQSAPVATTCAGCHGNLIAATEVEC